MNIFKNFHPTLSFPRSFFQLIGDLDELRQKDYGDQQGDKARRPRPKIDEKQVAKGEAISEFSIAT